MVKNPDGLDGNKREKVLREAEEHRGLGWGARRRSKSENVVHLGEEMEETEKLIR